MQQKMRRLRNLMFTFVFFVGLLALSAFASNSIKDSSSVNLQKGRAEISETKYKKLNPNFKKVQFEKKLLIF